MKVQVCLIIEARDGQGWMEGEVELPGRPMPGDILIFNKAMDGPEVCKFEGSMEWLVDEQKLRINCEETWKETPLNERFAHYKKFGFIVVEKATVRYRENEWKAT